MLRLRPYKKPDSIAIADWCSDKHAFDTWGGARFGEFPISAEIIDKKYTADNGDCVEPDNFYPMTAFDETGAVGSFIMRYIGGDNRILRFGWVIVDANKRGNGYGKEMLSLALKYAFEILKVSKVTIGVFENNTSAYRCYKSVGFKEASMDEPVFDEIDGEKWKIVELEIDKEDYENQ